MLAYQNKSLVNIKGELWKEVPGFEGYILISNLGRLKSLARYVERSNGSKGYWTKDRILSQTVTQVKNSYVGDSTFHLFCKVGFNGKRYHLNIRRLVYEAFIDSELSKKDKKLWVISVKRGNGLNSKASNLKLIHVRDRMLNSLKAGRTVLPAYKTTKEKKKAGIEKMRKTNWLAVKQYDIKGKLICRYLSIKEAAEKTGIGEGNIIASAKRKRYHGSGYVWRYDSDDYNGEYAALPRFQKIIQYGINGVKKAAYPSIAEASRKTGIHKNAIFLAVKGKLRTSGGYIWRYENVPFHTQ
ncbi:MAG TPA: NUMOD1 domain-containing DNA-binding protein [Parafilimonas sp.]|nr:NUMOD1 domain-containing DNA-binding protein [Parafilimonas sp.]